MEARYQATASPWLLHQSYLNDTIRSQSHGAWDQLMWVNKWFLEVSSCFWMKLVAKTVLHQKPPCGCCDHPLFGCKMLTYLQILCIYSLNSSKTWDSVRQTSLQIKVLSCNRNISNGEKFTERCSIFSLHLMVSKCLQTNPLSSVQAASDYRSLLLAKAVTGRFLLRQLMLVTINSLQWTLAKSQWNTHFP